jgi:hypothetical protein
MKSIMQKMDDVVVWKNEAGQLHRTDGPAAEWPNGTKEWYFKGRMHRLDGPAIESHTGTKEWYYDGKLHRIDGPAVILENKYESWYLNGRYFPSKEAWFNALTKEEQIAYLFKMEGSK